ncbi:MAG: replisome organizer [Clostridia bacterium]|nr:replisome organizer [Clostridia bacterium]
MANRRMFSLDVVDTDRFLEMPTSTQALYFHLGMRADDDGFVSSPKKICLLAGASEDDLKLLIAKNFLIPFPDGVCVITDWKMNNYLRPDRYKKTVYQEHFTRLSINEQTGAYRQSDTNGIPTVYQMDTQDRLGKVRIGKARIEIGKSTPEHEPKKKTSPCRHKYGEYQNVLLSDEELDKLQTEFPYDWQTRIERLSEYVASTGKSYKSHLATIRAWARKDSASTGANDRKWCTMNEPSPEEILGITEVTKHE